VVSEGLPPGGGIAVLDAEVHAMFLVGSAFCVVVLWRAGRACGQLDEGGWIRRMARGASIAPVYSLGVAGVALVSVLRFPASGVAEVRPIAWQSFAGALALGLVAGAAGGAAAAAEDAIPLGRWGRRALSSLVGGWVMTLTLLLLAFVGFLVVAGVRSDVSAAYVRALTRAGGTGAIVAGHHVLLLVNQSFMVAAPAMGGCLRIGGAASVPTTLCLRTLSVHPGFLSTFVPSFTSGTRQLPAVWLPFLFVPLGATVWGGSRAAAGAPGPFERCLRGAGAGVVFAVLVVAGEALSTVSVSRPTGEDLLRLGADLGRTGALALAWGVLGGSLGALLPILRQPEGVPEADPVPEPPPPSETSV
jgi:hypothetical protein